METRRRSKHKTVSDSVVSPEYTVNRCLLCWKSTGEQDSGSAYLEMQGAQGVEPLQRQLTTWFILRKLLELPLDWCEQQLRTEGAGGPELGQWFQVCAQCLDSFVRDAWEIQQQIKVLEKRISKIKAEVKQKVWKNASANEGEEELVKQIRDFLVVPPVTSETLEKDVEIKREGTDTRSIHYDEGQGQEHEELEGGMDDDPSDDWFPVEEERSLVVDERSLVDQVDSVKQSVKRKRGVKLITVPGKRRVQAESRSDRMPGVIYECPLKPECSKSTDKWPKMLSHVKGQHLEEVMTQLLQRYLHCDQCSFAGEKPRDVMVHKRRVHEPLLPVEVLKCDECAVLCSSQRDLNIHVNNAHRRLDRVVCEICGKGFKWQSELNRHEVTHFGHQAKDLWICEICGLEFKHKKSLQDHRNTWHSSQQDNGEVKKEFSCKYCSLTSPFKVVISRHLQTHRLEREWKCEPCDKRFLDKRALVRHQRTLHGDKREEVKCPLCCRSFPNKPYMQAHLKNYCKLRGRPGTGAEESPSVKKVKAEESTEQEQSQTERMVGTDKVSETDIQTTD